MSFGDFIKKSLMHFFIIVTCVTVVIGILGLIYEPNVKFGYEAFFSPLIFGAISIIPSIVTYSKEELTLKQMVFRKVLQLIVLEGILLIFGYLVVGIIKENMIISFAVSVLLVFLIVHFISWIIDCKKADVLNVDLKAFQGK